MSLITSTSNPRIKQIRALGQRKQRDQTGLCVAEGIFHVGEALAAGAPVEYLCYAPDRLASDFGRGLVEEAQRRGIPTFETAGEVLATVAGKDNPQGILAVVRQRRARLGDLTPRDLPWAVAVVAPQDPGNVGTILRTVDAAGASGLLLLDGGVDPYHPTAVRASMGAIFWLPVVVAAFDDFAGWADAHGYHVYGTSARGDTGYRDAWEAAVPLVLLMGSEQKGLAAEQAAVCERLLRLPMHGRVSSLNLAVATGIFLYAVHDQLAAAGALPLAPPATP